MTDVPFPYIVGVDRSGTTLLRAMLASHPDLAIPDEANFRLKLSVEPEQYEEANGLDLDAFVSALFADRMFRSWGTSEEEIRMALRAAAPRSLSDAMRALFLHAARKEGKTRYGDKTPQAVMVMPRLSRLFPEARFIHIIRDGRDVALSHIHTEGFIPSAAEVAIKWKTMIERGQSDGRILGPERYREVRYEQLVEKPEAVLRSLCAYIELDFQPSMLRYFERPLEVLGATQHGIGVHASLHKPPTKGLRNWRHQMEARDVENFEAIAGDLLERLAYGRSAPRPNIWTRVRAGFVRLFVAGKEIVKGRIVDYRWWPAARLAYRRLRRTRGAHELIIPCIPATSTGRCLRWSDLANACESLLDAGPLT
jgi:Sulfotransferase family